MNIELKERFIFGVDSSNVGCPVSFFNDNNIAYMAGNSVVIQNLITNSQRFVHSRGKYQIIGLVASANILIIVEEPKERPFIPCFSIYINNIQNCRVKTFEAEMNWYRITYRYR